MDIDYSPTGREFVTGSYDRTVSVVQLFLYLLQWWKHCTHILMDFSRWGFFSIMVDIAGKSIILRECKGLSTRCLYYVSFLVDPSVICNKTRLRPAKPKNWTGTRPYQTGTGNVRFSSGFCTFKKLGFQLVHISYLFKSWFSLVRFKTWTELVFFFFLSRLKATLF